LGDNAKFREKERAFRGNIDWRAAGEGEKYGTKEGGDIASQKKNVGGRGGPTPTRVREEKEKKEQFASTGNSEEEYPLKKLRKNQNRFFFFFKRGTRLLREITLGRSPEE